MAHDLSEAPIAGSSWFQHLAEGSSDIVTVIDREGVIEWVSPSVRTTLGWAVEDYIGCLIADLLHPDEALVMADTLARADAGQPTVHLRHRIRCADGRYRWLDSVVTIERDAPRTPRRGYVTSRDVHDEVVALELLAQSEQRYRLLAQNASDVVFQTRGTVVDWISPSSTEVLAWHPSQLLGTDLVALVHPDDRDRVAAARAARRPGVTSRVRYQLRRGDGTYRWFETCANVTVDDVTGELVTVASLRDVHDQVLARTEVEQARDQQHAILDSLLDPWILLAALRDDAGTIVDFEYVDANRAACQANGLTLPELVGRRLLELFPEHGPSGWLEAYARVVETGEPLTADDVPFGVPSNSEPRWFDNRAVRIDDGISFTWRDVTDRYMARHAAQVLARQDALTGLPNRLDLQERLPARLGRAHAGSALAVLFCDVDGFKGINDGHGHEVGDQVLVEVARRMTASLRSNDYVARLGGDEFVILLDRVRDAEEAESVAHKVRAAIARPMTFGSDDGRVTMSIGVVLATGHEEPRRVLASADRALYRAKDSGRDCVRVQT